ARDRVEPRRERSSCAEVVKPARRGEQRFLEYFAAVLGVPAHSHTEAQNRRRVTLEQLRQRGVITAAERLEQRLVFGCVGHTSNLTQPIELARQRIGAIDAL